jgi:hypothetical protein
MTNIWRHACCRFSRQTIRNPVLRDGVRALLASSLDMTLPAMLK